MSDSLNSGAETTGGGLIPASQAAPGHSPLATVKGGLSKRELADSRLFTNINTPARAAVVQAIAADLGMGVPFVAANLAFINGKPAMTGLLLGAAVKKSSKYRYVCKEKTDKQSVVAFYERIDGKWECVGVETFTWKMAERAGLLSNPSWKKFPEAMLFWRCLVAGVRTHCPDVLSAGPTHTIEELRPTATYDEDGVPVIDVEFEEVKPSEKLNEVKDLLKETNTDEARFLSYYGVGGVGELSREQIDDAAQKLTLKKEAMHAVRG